MKMRLYVHRAVYFDNHPEAPRDMDVCHTCDNRKCCNPDHLFIGARQDNMRDMLRKKRQNEESWLPKGTAHPKARLDEVAVLKIRDDDRPIGEIAKVFGVSPSTIRAVKKRISWAWLNE